MCEAAYPTKGHREPDYLPGGAVAVQLSNRLKIHKEPASNAGDIGLMPESGKSPGEGNGKPLSIFA